MIVTRADIVEAARQWSGTPYRHQAAARGVGCDCLGLVRGVWRELMGTEPAHVPPYSSDWAEAGGQETMFEAGRRFMVEIQPEDARAGDMLLFRWRDGVPAKHVAILTEVCDRLGTGPARIIHAYDAAGFVAEGNLAREWRRRIVAAFVFPFVEAD